MNKRELIDQIVARTGGTKKDAARVIDAFIDTVIQTVADDERVTLEGFGAFVPFTSKPTRVHSPGGQSIDVPAKKRPKFRPGIEFSQRVAGTKPRS